MPKNGQIVRTTKISSTAWRKGQGQAFRIQVNGLRTKRWKGYKEFAEMEVLGKREF